MGTFSSKKLKFARFGGLSSVNQRGYNSSMPSFHSPPASRGIYCFVWPHYEYFLLTGNTSSPYVSGSKFSYVRDDDGNIIGDKHPKFLELSEKFYSYWSIESKKWSEYRKIFPDDDDPDFYNIIKKLSKDWDEHNPGENKWVLVERPRPRIFEYGGEIWHHLSNNISGEFLGKKGAWVKTTMDVYRSALEKEENGAQKQMAKIMKDCGDPTWATMQKRRAMRLIAKDHLECFIEKI